MNKNRKILLAMVLSMALGLSACGGGGGDGTEANVAPSPPPDIGQSVASLLDFMRSLIAGTSETSDPIDINALTLAVDDTAEPSPL